MVSDGIVIVGGGHAGAALCLALEERGLAGKVLLYGQEPGLPYERPELSKSFLAPDARELPALLPAGWFERTGAKFKPGCRVVAIDRARRKIVDETGVETSYGKLVLATGAGARDLPGLPAGLRNVLTLRDLRDAQGLRDALAGHGALTIVGAGFVGLEVAAAVRKLGKEVRVVESAPGILGRSVSPVMAQHVRSLHEANGIGIRTGARIGGMTYRDGVLQAMEVDGRLEPVELLLVSIGALPRTELARQAGLSCDDGIRVDHRMCTSDPDILAIGDCARYFCSGYERLLRLESVQSAMEQAKRAADALSGNEPAQPGYGIVPWFWSDQGDIRLQMTGLADASMETHVRRTPGADGFSVLHYSATGKLCMAESLNMPGEHALLRRLLQSGRSVPADQLSDATIPLKTFLKAKAA